MDRNLSEISRRDLIKMLGAGALYATLPKTRYGHRTQKTE